MVRLSNSTPMRGWREPPALLWNQCLSVGQLNLKRIHGDGPMDDTLTEVLRKLIRRFEEVAEGYVSSSGRPAQTSLAVHLVKVTGWDDTTRYAKPIHNILIIQST